ncbi:uncharacterized protein LOC120666877 isoform X3 [Panicum virgatum]|uniref:uncharacterized protein LOC120666877 isoform X3 n=1 Tax=Panicum virgatum TaxID=38727 RepID=UPI0019D5A658|nr:uncharacterized protein LOC120666877 isoform X3 [Panicum virgatum]
MALGFHPMKYFLPLDRNRPAWAARIRNLESTTGTPQLSQEPRRTAAKNGGDEPRRGVSNRRHLPGTEYLPSRDDRGAGERRRPARRPSTDAAAKADDVGECRFREMSVKGKVALHPLQRNHASLTLRKSTCLVKSTNHFKHL